VQVGARGLGGAGEQLACGAGAARQGAGWVGGQCGRPQAAAAQRRALPARRGPRARTGAARQVRCPPGQAAGAGGARTRRQRHTAWSSSWWPHRCA
jgi:hypothetical protein